jgi:uncharacterized protein YbjT (DUF2867 family)
MTNKKHILVTGATGAQGGSVARHLLQDGNSVVHCLTRDPDSERARWLKSQGAEVFRGDFADQKSVNVALEGCDYVYGVTNFWEHFDKEYELGKNLVDAVASAGIEHLVLSTLPHIKKITQGELDVPHFDLKAKLEDYTRGLGISATFVHIAFYFENFISFFAPKREENGTYGFGFPQGDTPLAGVSAEDVGGVVAAIFDEPARFKGKAVVIAGDALPAAKYADLMTKILGKKVAYHHIPREVFASFGFPGADDLANMFEYYRLYNPYREKEISESRTLYPGMQKFETWLRRHTHDFHDLFEKQESSKPVQTR